jgi:signal transduction histidine kinase/DNA-binding response OmpR family regulator
LFDPSSFVARFAIIAALPIGALSCAVRADQQGLPLVTSFSSVELEENAQSWCVTEGPDGVLYFGSIRLVTFDGDRWRTFPVGGSYAIRSLDFSADGSRLWTAAFNEFGWFDEDRDGTWIYHSLVGFLPKELRQFGDCWYAFATEDGALFVTKDHVLRWDGRTMRSWSFPSKSRLSAMRLEGGVYLDDGITGLYRFAHDEFKLVIPESKIGGARVIWIGRAGSEWLLATTAGLATWDGASIQPIASSASSFIRDHQLVSVATLPGDRIAAATMTGGIAVIARDGRLLRVFDKANGSIPTNEVFNVATDRDGGLWATSNGHVFRVSPESNTVCFDRASAPSPDLFGAVASIGDRVYAATPTSIYQINSDPPGIPTEPLAKLPVSNVWKLVPFENGLLVSCAGGVDFVGSGFARHVWSGHVGVFGIAASHETGHVFFGTGYRQLFDLDFATSGVRQVVSELPDIPENIAEDSLGRIWIGSIASGISVVPNPSAPSPTVVSASNLFPEIPSAGYGDVRATAFGALFLFLDNRAWYLPAGGSTLQAIAGWPNRSVRSIRNDGLSLADPDGTVWVVHPPTDGNPACVASINPEGQGAVWRPHTIDGLWKVGAPASIYVQPTVNGDRLYITGSTGILRADANPTDPAVSPPTPLIRAFAQAGDNDSLQPISGPLPYNTRKLLLQVAVPEFARRPAVRPQVLIDGIDRAWTSFDSSSERELTGLRDGSYTAHVRVLADTGLASQPVEVSFTIRPPWWRTWPFEICVVAAIAALSYGGHLFRIRNLRRRAAELEEIVKRRTEQANRANAAKSDFIARVSHNIRNPLNGIVGLTLALSDTELQERQREILEALDACAHQLTSLIDDVLDFSRIEAGKVELKPTSCSPHALLESIATSLAARAAASDSMIEIKVDPALPPYVMVDAHRLEEILLNYMTNAIRYAPGHIVLRAAVSRQSPNILECSVQDRGPGFTDEEKDTLFTNFTRLADTAAMNTSGTGLGLALCRRLADLMSGSVGVEGSKGAGARFYVRLPLIPAEAPQPEIRSIFSIARALIVEDADYNAWAFTAILAHLGIHACDRARDGREALALFSDRHFDLILLDRHLPDTDGIVVAQKMRQLEENRAHTLIVCVSAYSTTEDRDRCLAAGMDYFAGKPLTPEKLSQILREAGVGFRPTSSMDLPQPPRRQGGINMSMLEYLAKGSGAPLSRQIERYVSALRGALAELEEIVSSADLAGTEAKAHSILGMARYVDAQELAELANAISGAARRGNLSELPNLIQRIQAAARQIIDELNGDGRTT